MTEGDYIQSDLIDLGAFAVADVPTFVGLEAQLDRVESAMRKPGSSISGFNGAGSGLEQDDPLE
jgi:hypothetical protein